MSYFELSLAHYVAYEIFYIYFLITLYLINESVLRASQRKFRHRVLSLLSLYHNAVFFRGLFIILFFCYFFLFNLLCCVSVSYHVFMFDRANETEKRFTRSKEPQFDNDYYL